MHFTTKKPIAISFNTGHENEPPLKKVKTTDLNLGVNQQNSN